MLVFIVVAAAAVAGVIVYALVQKSKEQKVESLTPIIDGKPEETAVKADTPVEEQVISPVQEAALEPTVEKDKKPKTAKKAGTRKPKTIK